MSIDIDIPTAQSIGDIADHTVEVTKEGYLPKAERKTVLLLSDDLRMHSGVGTMSREIVVNTAHRYNWVQLGAAVQHPEAGKIVDASQALSEASGVKDASLIIVPFNGYGNQQVVRQLLMAYKPDILMIFTDPRYWIWLFEMEHELRQVVPIVFYNIWDAPPPPLYNKNYYRSVDALFAISKQTHNLNRIVLEGDDIKDWQLKYLPHGVDSNIFKPVPEDDAELVEMRKQLFKDEDVEFSILYNNRNIRRKSTGDVLWAFKQFVADLPKEKKNKVRLIMHTAPVDDNGTDLPAVVRDVLPECEKLIIYSNPGLPTHKLNLLYNITDVTINMSSNEGFGLATMEAIMAGSMIIATVTGGLQDQMGFRDENGNLLNENIHFNKNFLTNSVKKYTTHGEWAIPLFPSNRSLIGSVPTPYIVDERPSYEDSAKAMREIFDMSKDERTRRGKLGREYAIENKFTTTEMGNGFIEGFEEVLKNWSPRKRFDIWKA
jgi:hypothetical protein